MAEKEHEIMKPIQNLLTIILLASCSVRTSEKQETQRYVKYPTYRAGERASNYPNTEKHILTNEKSEQPPTERLQYLPASEDPEFVYFTIATSEDLIEESVLDENGRFRGFTSEGVAQGFDAELFIAVQKKETTEIPLPKGAIHLATSHPSGSYQIHKSKADMATLLILKPEKFWQTSRYSVIVVNPANWHYHTLPAAY